MDKEYMTINPASDGTACTIKAQYARCAYANAVTDTGFKATFIMERETDAAEPKILGYSRDGKDAVVNRHTKDIANTVTASPFSSTTQYVAEPQVLRMERTEEEKLRRHEEGDRGAKFSAAKEMRPRRDGVANTLTSSTKDNLLREGTGWRIRKLTPRECFRLMDVDDADIDKIQAAGIPKTQQYKLAGNSIVVSVFYHILRKMLIEPADENPQLSLF